MASIRPTRNAISDSFPVVGFHVDVPADQDFEVVVTSDAALLQADRSRDRRPANFYSSGGEGFLTSPYGVAMYLLPPPALQAFAGNSRLYYALATRSRQPNATPQIAFTSTDRGPWISLDAYTGRQTRRPLMLPAAARKVVTNGASLHWMGDDISQKAATNGSATPTNGSASPRQETAPMPANGNGNGSVDSAAPAATAGFRGRVAAPMDYDDGFGPLPMSSEEDAGEDRGIESDINDMAFAYSHARAMSASTSEYPNAAEFIPAHAKSHHTPRKPRAIERVVIHVTYGKNPKASATANYMKSGAEERYVSSHYVVGQAGEVVQCVEEADVAYHANSANGNSIGIEHNANPKGLLPTQAQYEGSADLVAYLINKYGIPLDREHILGHSEADTKTTHTGCPNSVWDWGLYMDLLNARCASGAPATTQETLTGPEYPLASEYIEAHARAHREPSSPRTIDKVVIHITAGSNKDARGTAEYFRDGAEQRYVSSHYVIGQAGEVVQCAPESHEADHAKGANATSIGIEHCANLKNIPVTDAQYCASAALVAYLVDKYSIPCDRQHIIGHKEVPGTNKECPGPWDWDYFMDLVQSRQCKPRPTQAQAFDSAPGMLSPVTLTLRAFIPSPAVDAPFDVFGGDGRSFQKDGGTSRAEVSTQFLFKGSNGKPQLTNINRAFGETKQYANEDGVSVAGKPDWWRELREGATPNARKTLAVNNSNLSVQLGGDSVAGIASIPEKAVVVTFRIAAANPLMKTAPDIDGRFSVMVRHNGDRVEARVMGGHDEFPAYELYANDTLLYSYDPVASGGTPIGLVGTGDFDVELDTDYVDVGPASEFRLIPVRLQQALWRNRPVFRGLEIITPYYDPADPASALTCQNDAFSQAREEWFAGVPNTSIAPHSAICLLEMKDSSGAVVSRGTGFYIGRNRILTCAHNLSGKASVRIIPGCNGQGVEPYGSTTVQSSSWRIAPRYSGSGDWANDLAVIDNVPMAAPNDFWFSFLNATPSDQLPIVVCGYSSRSEAVPDLTKAIDGFKQHLHAGYAASQEGGETIQYPILTLKRASGSPVYHISQGDSGELAALVTAVHVTGEPAAKGLNGGCFITPTKIDWIEGRATTFTRRGATRVMPSPRSGYRSVSFEGQSFDVNWTDAFLVAQPNELTCWAASGAMVLGWRDQRSFTPDEIIRLAGRWAQRSKVLPWTEHQAFAEKLGLVSEPLVCYAVDGFRALLETYGPLLVIRAQSDTGDTHAVVVTRMYGDGTPDGTFVRMLDPQGRFTGTPSNPGSYISPLTNNCSTVNGRQECYYEGGEYDLTFTVFSQLFEKGARDRLGVQVMHVPSIPQGRARTSTSQAYAGRMSRSVQRFASRGVSQSSAYLPPQRSRSFDATPEPPAPVGAEAIQRVRNVMNQNASLPPNRQRVGGIELLNDGLRAFYGAVLQAPDGSPARLGGNVMQSMSELQRLGLTESPELFDYLDSAGQPTNGDDRPDRLDRSVEDWLMDHFGRSGLAGWHLLALSLLDGNQCALLAVQYSGVGNTATKIFWADQIDAWSEVTSGLDARVTDYTQRYWDSILAHQRNRARTQSAIWALSPAPVLQEAGPR